MTMSSPPARPTRFENWEIAFGAAGLNWKHYVVVDPALLRPAEVELLQGDSAKARTHLRWKPRIPFQELIEMMVKADLEQYERGQKDGVR